MTPQNYSYLSDFLKQRSGFVLGAGRDMLVSARLGRMARELGFPSLGGLVSELESAQDPRLASRVVEAMTINETYFLRERAGLDAIIGTILPQLAQTRGGARRAAVWCAAVSTGQEAYSLAILAREAGLLDALPHLRIVGTDIAQEALKTAGKGVYSQFDVQRGLPIKSLVRHFAEVPGGWRIAPELRQLVTFVHHNLLDDFRIGERFDVVLCRNVLFYFDAATQADVVTRLAATMRPGGHLLIGASERLRDPGGLFAAAPGPVGLYRLKA